MALSGLVFSLVQGRSFLQLDLLLFILSYLIGGLIVTLIMFMLGELAAYHPDSGSFSTYASNYLGEWAGYMIVSSALFFALLLWDCKITLL